MSCGGVAGRVREGCQSAVTQGKNFLMLGSNACFGIMYFVPLCYIQIKAELDVSNLKYVTTRISRYIKKPLQK